MGPKSMVCLVCVHLMTHSANLKQRNLTDKTTEDTRNYLFKAVTQSHTLNRVEKQQHHTFTTPFYNYTVIF